ncbi:MAG: structural protein P5, partial [Bacteroidaceae bacterium]|nr:structural protein P5 [Bacteroidaceae bacterium]
MTIGQRNNNPLNIRKVRGTHWKGEVIKASPSRGGLEGSPFVQFETAEWGIRAAFCILETYKRKYQAVCVEDIISRWAPPSENNTKAYINAVCKATGYGAKERLGQNQLGRLIMAM